MSSMIGRRELLAQARAQLTAGPGLLLYGPAGIGKSALIAALASGAAPGVTVLRCAPAEQEAKLPFAGLVDLFHHVPGDRLDALPPVPRAALRAALLREREPTPASGRLAVRVAVLDVLRSLAAAGPVRLVLDGLQWLDEPSAQVLAFAVRRLESDDSMEARESDGRQRKLKGPMGQRLTRRGFTVAATALLSSMLAAGDAAAATPAPGAGPRGHRNPPAPRQLRGMWIATVENVDWPSAPGLPAAQQRQELLDLLDVAVERRLNAVLLQVRPAADALWPSPYEPWSRYLTGTQGQDPGWDPLGTAVHEAHRRGLELHAWFNPYRIANNTDLSRLVPTHPARVHPEWVVPYGGKLYYNPGLPEVRRFVQDAMLDAVRRYRVDAVHWDDYFYPYPVAGQVFDDDAFTRYGAGFPDRSAWRRHNNDLLVQEMSARIKRIRRRTRFGISPFGVWRNRATDPLGSRTTAGVQTYDDLYADTRGWVRHAWLDYIALQVYWNIGFAAADYAELVPWWSDVVEGTGVHLYIGEALYKAGAAGQPAAWQDPAELSRHLAFDADHPQVRGNIYFSAKNVVADPIGAMSQVVADHYPTRVKPPR